MASQCCDFIANVTGSGIAHSFLETEFNQIKCFHLKANIDLVTMKGKSSTYLNKHLIPEIVSVDPFDHPEKKKNGFVASLSQ